jgi:hypothetical protein
MLIVAAFRRLRAETWVANGVYTQSSPRIMTHRAFEG